MTYEMKPLSCNPTKLNGLNNINWEKVSALYRSHERA